MYKREGRSVGTYYPLMAEARFKLKGKFIPLEVEVRIK